MRTLAKVGVGAALGATALLVGVSFWALRAKHAPQRVLARTEAGPVIPSVQEPKRLQDFVAKESRNPDPKVQDAVSTARLRLGYAAANTRDWGGARATFQVAAREYRGTGAMSGAFGSLPDQAA